MSVRKTWVYKIPQSKTKPKDENVRILLFIIVLVGVTLLWVILKAQNEKSSNQNHHYLTNDATIKDYFACCVTMCLWLCSVKKLCAVDVEKIIKPTPPVGSPTLPPKKI